MRGDYKDIAFTNFAGGLNTRIDSNLIADNESPDIQNVVFDGKGSIMPRMGTTLFGSSASVLGQVRRTWVTTNVRDEEIPLRQVETSGSNWLEYYNPQLASWYTLDDGYTRSFDFGNAMYDYNTYYCSQKDHQRRWNGVCWSTSTYADSAYAKVYINTSAASALGFLSAGSVVIDGEEVYYSALSGNALSGITFSNAHNGNVPVAQLPTSAGEAPAVDGGWCSASNLLPKGSILYEMDSQMFVAGASGVSGNVVYYSAINEPWNFTISATPGGGGTARYPETTGSIKSLTEFDSVLTVLKENTIRRLKFQDLADGTAGSLEIVSRENIFTAPKIGAINNKSVTRVENDIVYVSPAGWIKSLSKTIAGTNITNELSKNIRPTVEDLNFTNAAAIYFDGKYYVACATADSTFNNVVLVWDYDFNAWTKFIGWNVADWFIYGNTLYYGASNEMATYQVHYNYDDNGSAYNSYWASKWMDFGVPNEQKRLGLVYVEGWITQNTSLGISAFFDGDTSSSVSKTVSGTGGYVSTTETLSYMGLNTWGLGTYGGGSGSATFTLRKFRWWGRYSGKNFYNLQIKIGANSPGYVWKITHIAPYLEKIPGKRIPTNSII